MKAIQVFGPRHMRMVDVPEPQRESGQLLIRSEVLSICGSDMRSFRYAFPEEQYPLAPCMPCHECVGIVEESDSAEVPAGTRVIALNIGRGGRGGNYGMGAQWVLSAPDLVIPLPEGADPSTYIMCQPVGTVLYAAKRLPNIIGQTVVVLGQGVIGLTFTRLAVQMGAGRVIAVDHHDYRLAKSRQLGATHTVNSYNEDPIAVVGALTNGAGADVVIEAAGQVETVEMIKGLVKMFGTIALFGLPEEPKIEIDYVGLMRRQAVIIPNVSASTNDPTGCIKETVELVNSGQLGRVVAGDAPAAVLGGAQGVRDVRGVRGRDHQGGDGRQGVGGRPSTGSGRTGEARRPFVLREIEAWGAAPWIPACAGMTE